jgi:peptidoglycan/LPS O-acetylase OafA/YrhL
MVDAWRGLAALGVVCYHLGVGPGWDFDLGHACVMVFFVISGYCIAASTESCRRNQVSPGGYMWRRVRRIYPPYFFAICFFAATRLVKMQMGMSGELSTSLVAWLQNLTMTQWFSLVFHPPRIHSIIRRCLLRAFGH